MVGGVLFKDYCPICNGCEQKWQLKGVFEEVRDFAYGIIERKGETSYGIGSALVRISEAILKDENSILPVSCLVEDYYGVSGVYMSLPAMVNKQGVGKILKIELDDKEAEQLKKSAGIIKSVIKELGL